MHSKPYISLIGHAGDNHGISNREIDEMSRDPPLPGAIPMSGICCLYRCSRILALRCPFCENTKKATKNPTARPTKGTRRATVPPKPPLKAHMHIVTHLVHLQPRAIIHQIVRQCTWEFRLPTSRDEKKRRYPEMNQSSNVRARRGSV